MPWPKGKPRAESSKQKMREKLLGRHCPWSEGESSPMKRPEVKAKIMGDRNPTKRPEVKAKISAKSKAWWTPEQRVARSIAMSGENHPNWQGGISHEPYCEKFDEAFRERVRTFWGFKCGNCGRPQSENITKNGKVCKLSVHHVHNNKDACCNDDLPWHFIPLCVSCHGKAGHNTKRWERKFTTIIKNKYGGRCYFHQGEQLTAYSVGVS